MNYEKKYKEALERARNIRFGDPNSATANVVCEEIFPELAESDDEKIRKEILSIVKSYRENCITEGNHRFDDCIAWLEKQGEPQPYKGNADTMRKNLIKAFKSVGSNHWGGFDVRDIIHFLESKDAIELEKQGEPNWAHHKVDLSDCSKEYRKAYYDGWNNCNKQHSQLKDEQNPAWSEEDELMLTSTVNTLKLTNGAAQMKIDWLKSIKNRVQPQQKQEWSISDERILNNIFTYLGYAKDGNKYCTPELICEAENWLKFLKPQPHWKPTDEQMQSLNFAIITYSKKDDCKLTYDGLNLLYNDLKKL